MEWSRKGEYFYTESWQARKTNAVGGYCWEKYTSGNGYTLTSRSYAGQFLNYIDYYYYSGVDGYFHRYNRTTKRYEDREQYTKSCNLLTWGYNNW